MPGAVLGFRINRYHVAGLELVPVKLKTTDAISLTEPACQSHG